LGFLLEHLVVGQILAHFRGEGKKLSSLFPDVTNFPSFFSLPAEVVFSQTRSNWTPIVKVPNKKDPGEEAQKEVKKLFSGSVFCLMSSVSCLRPFLGKEKQTQTQTKNTNDKRNKTIYNTEGRSSKNLPEPSRIFWNHLSGLLTTSSFCLFFFLYSFLFSTAPVLPLWSDRDRDQIYGEKENFN